jgi:hypothetical protein
MATYNLTTTATKGVGANVIASLPDVRNQAYMIEGVLDIAKLISAGAFTSAASGDIFEVLEIPAGTLVVAAGAQVLTAFNSSAAADIDFAAGDDIVDGQLLTSTGYLSGGSNGTTIGTSSPNYVQFVTTTDTIDVKLTAGTTVTAGKLRIFAVVVDLNSVANTADEVDRDQLA